MAKMDAEVLVVVTCIPCHSNLWDLVPQATSSEEEVTLLHLLSQLISSSCYPKPIGDRRTWPGGLSRLVGSSSKLSQRGPHSFL